MSPDNTRREKAGPATYVVIFGVAALLLASFLDVRAQLLCKLIGDTFVSGYSATKGVAFLLFVLLVFCSRLVRLPSPRRLPALVTLGVAACLTLSAIEHGLYCYAVALPWRQWSWLCVGGEYSFHGLLHFHVSKIPVALLADYHGDQFDTGEPFLTIFATWLAALHLALFLAAAAAMVLLLRRWSFEKPPGYFLTILIASAGVFKCLIDGGPMEGEFLIPLTPLLLALWGRRVALACLPVQALLMAFRLTFPESQRLTVEYFHLATIVLVLALPSLVQKLSFTHRRLATVVGILALPFLGGVLWWEADRTGGFFQVPRALHLYRYGQTTLQPGTPFHLVSPAELRVEDADFVLEKHYRGVRYHQYEGRVNRPLTIAEICSRTGTNLLRRPVSLSWAPTRSTVRGTLFDDWDKDWPRSEMVLGYSASSEGREVELEIVFRPGANLNVYRDALPSGIFVMTETRTVSELPGQTWTTPDPQPPLPRGHLRWLPGLRRH